MEGHTHVSSADMIQVSQYEAAIHEHTHTHASWRCVHTILFGCYDAAVRQHEHTALQTSEPMANGLTLTM